MGAWEEQAKRITQHRKLWSEAQQFSFIHALQNSANEEEVKAATPVKVNLCTIDS